MQRYITSIKYQNVGGDEPYQITVSFARGGSATFSYSKTRVSNSPVVNNSKNYKRNEVVKDMIERYPALRGKTLAEVRQYSTSQGGGVKQEIDTFLNDLAFQLWWKEMGDTSFPLWIQSYMGTHGLKADNTVICSIDWGVIYRSLVNGMACALQMGAQTTYYPIIEGVYKAQMVAPGAQGKRGRGEKTVRSLKKTLLTELLRNNTEVLTTLRKCKRIVEANPMCLLGSITEPTWYIYAGEYKEFRMDILSSFMLVLCNTMIQYVKPLMEGIEAELTPESETPDGLAEFRTRVGNYRLKTPFVPFAKDEFTIPKHSFQFLSVKIGGSGDHMFGLSAIFRLYSDVYKRAELQEPTAIQLMMCMKEIYGFTVDPLPAEWEEEAVEDTVEILQEEEEEEEEEEGSQGSQGAKRRRTQGGGGLSEEDQALYRDLLRTNRGVPNYLLYFVHLYVPEFFPMALAYELAVHPTQAILDAYKPVLTQSILQKSLAPFGRTVGGVLEYSEPLIRRSMSGSAASPSAAKVDRTALVQHACSILKGARDAEQNILFKLCEKKAPELLWFIEAVGGPATPLPKEAGRAVHLRALGYYQQFYDEDVRLCILNKRGLETPLEGIDLNKVVKASGTPGRSLSQEAKERFIEPFLPIYERYAAAAAATALKQKPRARGFFQSTSALRKRFGSSTKRLNARRKSIQTRRHRGVSKP
jgi:hypothetical protein